MPSKKLFTSLLLVILVSLLASAVIAQTTYVIQPGDTLSAIARSFGVSVQDIAAANNIVNPNLIYAGQTLIIPDSSPPSETPPSEAPPSTATTYTIQRGDTLLRIAAIHGVSLQALIQANNLANPNLIFAGQVLSIPGAQPPAPQPPPESTPAPSPTQAPPSETPPPPPSSANLLPNPSFEGGYYHQNGIPELQVPNGWQFEFDQGVGAPGTGIPFVRPESRVLPDYLIPAHERPIFFFDGIWTIKVFKGDVPISFRLFTDVHLEPGTYQFTARYFPDLVVSYSGGKTFSSQPSAGEVAFILTGGGSGWATVTPGTRNNLVQTFTINTPGTVRVGVAFRTRYAMPNNGFFIDDWSLNRIGE
jgi:LysM repeat protein